MNRKHRSQYRVSPSYVHPGNIDLNKITLPSLKISSTTANPLLDRLIKDAGIVMPYSNQTWEQLEAIYQSLAGCIIAIGQQVANMVKQIEASQAKSDSLINIVKATDNDLSTFVKRAVAQHNLHKKHSGRVRDGEDLNKCLQIFQEYQAIQEQLVDVLEPNISLLGEILQNRYDELKALEAKKAETTNVEEAVVVAPEANPEV